MDDSVRKTFSDRRYKELADLQYQKETVNLIKNSLTNLLIGDNINGFRIALEEQINLLFLKKSGSNTVPLKFEDLPPAFTIKDGIKVPLTENLFNEFKNLKKPLFVVHDSNDEFGVVAADIFTEMRLNDGEVIYEGYKHTRSGEFSDQVFHNIYLGDSDFNTLVSKVDIKSNGNHIVKQSGWELSHIKISVSGDYISLQATEYYTAFGITSGGQRFCFLQKTTAKMSPYDYHKKILPDISIKPKYKEKIETVALESVDKLSKDADDTLILVANFLYQLGKAYQEDYNDLFVSDKLLQVNEESRELADGTKIPYTKESFIQILEALDPGNLLKDMALFQIDSSGSLKYDTPSIKTFFKTWLELIKADLNKPPSESSTYLIDLAI
ncbi:hypothetical protein LCGC14_1574820 [marine sediment metagenome]|uniref:Uncharacterized protein n=1 Tax=marine sediment metagenome TaxID=412755 RepID=A0A0F9IIK8_9ZZZZ|nr:hypothetical protein [archaeon]